MASVLQANKLITEWLANDPSAEITTIEKSVDGRVTIEEISDSLREYANLFKAGYSSPAQTLTLHRAYPDNPLYAEMVKDQDLTQKDPNVVGGPASVEMIDREGHLITTKALSKAFDQYMKNPMTRNVMVMHSDIQVGWALPAYISKSGQIYKSGIGDNTLFFITELRDDTKISKRVIEEIKKSRMKSYSIAGSAIRTENVTGNMFKGEPPYMRVDELELAEVTICEKGVNQGAGFDLIKSNRPTQSCADESCFISKNEGHAHNQETKTMTFDEYKELLTSRDGQSFAKMFSEYTYVYKEEKADQLSMFGSEEKPTVAKKPSAKKPSAKKPGTLPPPIDDPKGTHAGVIKIPNDGKSYTLDHSNRSLYEEGKEYRIETDSDTAQPPKKAITQHKLDAWTKFKEGQKTAGITRAEAQENFERSYNPDRPNKSAAPKAATGRRAKIDPAANNIPAKQIRGKMLERYMAGVHPPEKMKAWMKQYGIDPRNIEHHAHMQLTGEQHASATARRESNAAKRQAQYTPSKSNPKKAMKNDMLYTLLGLTRR